MWLLFLEEHACDIEIVGIEFMRAKTKIFARTVDALRGEIIVAREGLFVFSPLGRLVPRNILLIYNEIGSLNCDAPFNGTNLSDFFFSSFLI